MEAPRRGKSFAGLVTELDDRLPREEAPVETVMPGRTVPTWVAFALICIVFVGGGWLVLKPTQDTCEFSETVCAIEDLDIDALLLTIPDADLFDLLPAIDEIDPDDQLTLGDVLRLDGISEIDPSALISPTELDRVLSQLGE